MNNGVQQTNDTGSGTNTQRRWHNITIDGSQQHSRQDGQHITLQEGARAQHPTTLLSYNNNSICVLI